jgi:hypothetical protein
MATNSEAGEMHEVTQMKKRIIDASIQKGYLH